MSKRVFHAHAGRRRLLGFAAFAVVFLLFAASEARAADGGWAPAHPAVVLVGAFALILVALRWRAFASAAQRGDAGRYPVAMAVPDVPAERHAGGSVRQLAKKLETAPPPGPKGEDPPRHSPTLDRIRSHMDEVTYAPGNPNVLSMTKYLRDERLDRAAEAHAGEPRLAPDEAVAGFYSRSDAGDETVIAIRGVLDAVTTPGLRPALEAVIAERRKAVTVDLSALRLIDSSGVGVIVSLYKRCKAFGGAMQVTGLKDQPLAIFRLLRLDRIFAVP